MPGKDSSGLQRFVQQRNSAQDESRPGHASGGKASFDDLKVPAPALPNSRLVRSANQHLSQPTNGPRQGALPRQHQASNEQNAFYDTDASAADKSSKTESVKRANTGANRAHQPQPYADGGRGGSEASGSADGSGDEYEYVEYFDDDLPDDPLDEKPAPRITGDLNQKQRRTVQAIESGNRAKHGGEGMPHIKGDTYPSTTSGRPSLSGESDRTKAQPAQHNQALPTAQPQQYGSHAVARTPLGPPNVQNTASVHPAFPAGHREYTVTTQDGFFKTPALPGTIVEQDVNSGFNFGKPPSTKQQPAARPPKQARPQAQQPQAPLPQQSLSTNTAQQGSHPAAKPNPTERPAAYKAPKLPPDDVAALQLREKRRSKSQQHISRTTTPTQQRMAETAPEPETLSDAAPEDERGLPNGFKQQEEQYEEPKDELDYEPAELYTMEYRALKKANFDVNPKAAPFSTPDDLPANTLTEQLASASRFQAGDQARFMATLDINQWEDAGEWFLGRFTELMSRFKGARQAKRKAASRFEEEVEARHGAVSKKRKLTETALSEMKASGAQVLQGTPKKMKKTK